MSSRRAPKRNLSKTKYKEPTSSSELSSSDDEPLIKSVRKKSALKITDEDDDGSSSDSSLDECLKSADKLDLNSSFFYVPEPSNYIPKAETSQIATLSDNDESDMESVKDESITIPNAFQEIEDYQKTLEDAKEKISNFQQNLASNNLDIKELLAMGEGGAATEEFFAYEDTDEEMEVVENKSIDIVETQPKDLQIHVELPGAPKKKEVDVLASIKRKINQVKKKYQIYVHKVHLLCWIAHGNYVNSILNNEKLLGLALSIIPSQNCYPEGRITLAYIEQITSWYEKIMKLVPQAPKSLDVLLTELPLLQSLQLQINKRRANSKKEFVLIFICILRALGIQCRLVLSLRVAPIRPPASELLSLSKKDEKDTKKEIKGKNVPKKESKTKKSEEKVVKSSFFNKTTPSPAKKLKPLKIPQLDGANHESPKISKTRNVKKDMPSTSKEKSKVVKKSAVEISPKKTRSRVSLAKKTIHEVTNEGDAKKKPAPKIVVDKHSSDLEDFEVGRKSRANRSKSETTNKNTLKPTTNGRSKSQNALTSTKVVKPSPKNVKPTSKIIKPETASSKVNKSTPKKVKLETTSSFFKKDLKVANDVVDLVKARMTEQKYKDKIARGKKVSFQDDSDESDSDYAPEVDAVKRRKSDEDFDMKTKKKITTKVNQLKKIDKRVLSTDDDEYEDKKSKKEGNDTWLEVFVEEEEKWVSVDVTKKQVHCVQELHSRATQPVVYVVAWNNNGTLKDVTMRYSRNWNTITRKLRVDTHWWHQTLKPYLEKRNAREKEEDEELARQQLDKPLPTSIAEYKDHPLYVLRRHLLKFQAIYPPDPPTLGFVRNEAVYARECVYTLHSREIWVKQARVVKPGEEPYKIVKARPKWDRATGTSIAPLPLEIFGIWQTQDYVPPTAENGVVPRNAYGNVELFKMCMLPKGTVHLQLPGLNKVARKLQIDCAPAVVGFDFHSGSSHPTFDGFVVCEEFKDTIIAAWEQDQIEVLKRAREKIEKRVYGNWRRIINGLYIRERLKRRYNFGEKDEKEDTKPTTNKKATKTNTNEKPAANKSNKPKESTSKCSKRKVFSDSDSD